METEKKPDLDTADKETDVTEQGRKLIASLAGRIESVDSYADAKRLGGMIVSYGAVDDGVRAIEDFCETFPESKYAKYLLSLICCYNKDYGKAESLLENILENSEDPEVLVQLGELCGCQRQVSRAYEYAIRAVELDKNRAESLLFYFKSLLYSGRAQEAIDLAENRFNGCDDRYLSEVHMYHLHYRPEIDRQQLWNAHREWAQKYCPSSLARTVHDRCREAGRRLRIGYISPDFKRHSVAYFFEPLLDEHTGAVEVFGYGNVRDPDGVTERLSSKFSVYRNIFGLDHDAAAEMIEKDKIDILVDLAGHTNSNCLGVMARKPAPIQVTWLGYPDTTGLEAVDYRFTDSDSETSDSQDYYSEKLVDLPGGFLCYRPPEKTPDITPLPALRNGYVTFCSFNNIAKINWKIISYWCEILKAVENSRMVMKFFSGSDDRMREQFFREFEKNGVSRDRIALLAAEPRLIDHLSLYSNIDIALDSYPYNGTTTTCEALWMGIPVISLAGEHHESRVGKSILNKLGLGFFAAEGRDEYIAKAAALAGNTKSLAALRATLRQRMAVSSICDEKGFAVKIENEYRKMWENWLQVTG